MLIKKSRESSVVADEERAKRFGRMCYESRGCEIGEKRVRVYRVKPAE